MVYLSEDDLHGGISQVPFDIHFLFCPDFANALRMDGIGAVGVSRISGQAIYCTAWSSEIG